MTPNVHYRHRQDCHQARIQKKIILFSRLRIDPSTSGRFAIANWRIQAWYLTLITEWVTTSWTYSINKHTVRILVPFYIVIIK